MRRIGLFGIIGAAALAAAGAFADYPIAATRPVDARATGGFWLARVETNRLVTLKTDFAKCNETPRIANFTNCAARAHGKFRGIFFDDSDVYKVMEGAAYIYAQSKDPELAKYMDWLIGEVAKAQEPDGYLYTARTLGGEQSIDGTPRWENLEWSHELYNPGHMIEAAVAWYEATGKTNFLDVARRNADLIDRTFGWEPGKIKLPTGHQEMELALCKLYRVTGEKRYLNLAKFLLDVRGRADVRKVWGVSVQDHLPVLEQTEALGHAVRAGYMYSGMADVAALTGDPSYVKAISVLWENVVGRKLALHGGIGARPHFDHPKWGGAGECFSVDYDIPNDAGETYNETCAAIANMLWNERMFRATGLSKYVDVLELTLYNGFLSGVSLSGDEFFYPNPLASNNGYRRSKWFGCSCCPVNIVRFIPQVPALAFATKPGTIYWNLFVEGTTKVGGYEFAVKTDYPWSGKVTLTVLQAPSSKPQAPSSKLPAPSSKLQALKVRIPGWAVGRVVPSDLYVQTKPGTFNDVLVEVNGLALNGCPGLDGYVDIGRDWKKGDVVTLEMPLDVKRIRAHAKVASEQGRLAVMRGPVVFCAEGCDNGGSAYSAVLPASATFAEGSFAVGSEKFPMLRASTGLNLIPYFTWNNRRPGNEMQAWFRDGAVLPLPDSVARPKAEKILKNLTLDEKVSLLGGVATMYLKAMPEKGIPREWAMSDCSHAMKPEHGRTDWPYVQGVDDRSVVLPPLSALATTWNRDLARVHGDVMGEQFRARGKDQMLGPGVNIWRTPRCGRNWEYLSEDPFLAGALVVPLVRAVQSHGVATTVKHFCLNNQELNRGAVDAIVDERTFNEIYLPAFRAAIVEGGSLAVMTSYNKVNGTWASENAYLQRGILRDRYGLKGMIVTDWGGQHSTVAAALAGGNVEMDRGKGIVYFTDHCNNRLPLADAVRRGDVPAATVDEMALHVLYTMAKTGFLDGVQPKGERLTERHHRMARQIGEEAIVLLKNEAGVLPLDRAKTKKLVVLGMQADLKVCGNGSSCEAHAEYEITPFAGLKEFLGDGADVKIYPLGGEGSPDGRPIRIPKEILETTKPNGGEAFVSRAWEVQGWPAGTKAWIDPSKVIGYTDYPTGTKASDLRYHAKIRATETGPHQFLAAAGAKTGVLNVFVNDQHVFSQRGDVVTSSAIDLKKDEVFDVMIDIGGCPGENAFAFGWRPPSAAAAGKAEKLAACKAADAVIVFTGTTIGVGRARECEGVDLTSMEEPVGHDAEIAELLKMNIKNLVIVNRSGTPMAMPWADDAKTLVQSSYLGQEAGRPFARTLFGRVNPSGRLAATWPKCEADTPVAKKGTYAEGKSIYNEGLYVGYRWYDAEHIAPRFPFGYGLSYTTFAWTAPQVETRADGSYRVTVSVKNTGTVAGKDVVQLYVEPIRSAVARPVRELKGFAKTRLLRPGESETVAIDLPARAFAHYDVLLHRWHALAGRYDLVAGASSADFRGRVRVNVAKDTVFADAP